jgi:hypothetical protein
VLDVRRACGEGGARPGGGHRGWGHGREEKVREEAGVAAGGHGGRGWRAGAAHGQRVRCMATRHVRAGAVESGRRRRFDCVSVYLVSSVEFWNWNHFRPMHQELPESSIDRAENKILNGSNG